MTPRPFQNVGGVSPGRTRFNLTHEKKFTGNMGPLYPVMIIKCVPGDYFRLGVECVVRHQPLVSPPMHEVNIYFYDFFVPFRILATKPGFNFEKYYTKGKDGKALDSVPKYTLTSQDIQLGSLADHFGFPLVANVVIDAWPWLAYNMIYNEYFRDQDLIKKIVNPFLAKDPEDDEDYDPMPVFPRLSAWEKDYFTVCRPAQQRGPEVAFPVKNILDVTKFLSTTAIVTPLPSSSPYEPLNFINSYSTSNAYVSNLQAKTNISNWLNRFLSYSDTASFDVKDLRDIVQLQKWMERNMRAGVRFTEFLRSHFGVTPRDERLQRPEYLGGHKSPVIYSEVLQTSQSSDNSPQGNLAGHGITADRGFMSSYRVTEPGIVMRLMRIIPRTTYSQGVNRTWQTETIYDEYFQEFAHLSEQAVLNQEIYATATNQDKQIFGFIPKYDEYRYIPSFFSSGMRTDFRHWHFGRQFGNLPKLNKDFVECNPRKDAYAVPSEDTLVINVGNIVDAVRPMPRLGEPGLVDHF